MKTGFFDRVTLCSQCGAPLQADAALGAVRCGKCGAESRLELRVDDAISGGWAEDELARLAHLRTQRRAFDLDPTLSPLVAGMRVPRNGAAAALGAWQRLRAATRPGDVAAERPFAQLTLLLAWRAAEDADPYRERGLLETALGVVRAPRHAQMLRAALAALAARMGDLAGAESWLALCDPRSADLRADSHYRFARALLDTAHGKFSRVLWVLGGNDVEVPAVDELAGPTCLLRANAWERLGRPSAALDLLIHYKFDGDPFGQQLTRSFQRIVRQLALCPGSEPRAEAQRLVSLGRRRVRWTGGMLVISVLIAHFVVWAAALVVFGLASLLVGSGEGLVQSVFFAFILMVPAGTLLLPFSGAYARTRRRREALAEGEIAPAQILQSTETSRSAASLAYAAKVRVVPDDAPPFELQTTIDGSPERAAELRSGRPFTVRYRGQEILIEPVLR